MSERSCASRWRCTHSSPRTRSAASGARPWLLLSPGCGAVAAGRGSTRQWLAPTCPRCAPRPPAAGSMTRRRRAWAATCAASAACTTRPPTSRRRHGVGLPLAAPQLRCAGLLLLQPCATAHGRPAACCCWAHRCAGRVHGRGARDVSAAAGGRHCHQRCPGRGAAGAGRPAGAVKAGAARAAVVAAVARLPASPPRSPLCAAFTGCLASRRRLTSAPASRAALASGGSERAREGDGVLAARGQQWGLEWGLYRAGLAES